ncbi:DNA modification methylase [Haloechinothrix salitolerans]|uniref:DNA modification methylase n=1 Tax=Haloechinothrix salitolerans TaxID=926830 RepID=A0ABW2C4M2_9PSEU
MANIVPDSRPISRPTSAWATGEIGQTEQLADRYVAATRTAMVAMTPAIARRCILTYTAPGATVLDPNPTAGIALTEAARTGRHAVGIQPRQPQWQSVCDANLDLAWLAGAPAPARTLTGIADPQVANLPAAVDLVLTGVLLDRDGGHYNRALLDLYDDLRGVIDWVWPGGYVIITCRAWHTSRGLLDLPGEVDDIARAVGLAPHDRCVALTSPIRLRPGSAATHIDVMIYIVCQGRAPCLSLRA